LKQNDKISLAGHTRSAGHPHKNNARHVNLAPLLYDSPQLGVAQSLLQIVTNYANSELIYSDKHPEYGTGHDKCSKSDDSTKRRDAPMIVLSQHEEYHLLGYDAV
jgi:response regulator RpfG family c-di-GMP phosphodiesterase